MSIVQRILMYVLKPGPAPMSPPTTNSTVILGGGIIGLSTAYYLARETVHSCSSNSATTHQITVVDPASEICAGASGQNEGVVGSFGIEDALSPLGRLSGKLHRELADQYNGREQYGYIGLDSHAIFSDRYDPNDPRLPYPTKEEESIDRLPDWLRIPRTWKAGVVSTRNVTDKLDARKFCTFLQHRCEQMGVKFMFESMATDVKRTLASEEITIKNRKTQDIVHLPYHNLVLATGSWTAKVFESLFPKADISIPMTKIQVAQTWLRIRSPNWPPKEKPQSCDQAWLAPALQDEDLHISSYDDGDFFVGGAFEYPEKSPELPEDVVMTNEEAENMRRSIQRFMTLGEDQEVSLLAHGRAYMPRTMDDLPIICKLSPQILSSQGDAAEHRSESPQGRVFVNVGQYLDGLTLGPGSGKVMSELILGKEPSIDLAPFRLPRT